MRNLLVLSTIIAMSLFVGGQVAAESTAKSFSKKSMVGSWYMPGETLPDSNVFTFLPNGEYVGWFKHTNECVSQDGAEYGTYVYDQKQHILSGEAVRDDNGCVGLSHADVSFQFDYEVIVKGDTLTVISDEGTYTFYRVK